ncbi:hypothetical protein NT945_002119 [Salmonella enterica]|nr:hypothetical protein [Salmonella enterica]
MAVQGVDAATNLALSRSGQDVDYYDAKGMPVKNLKDPTDPQDAVTKNVLDSAVAAMGQQVNDAKMHLDVVNQSVLQNALKAQQAQVQVEQKIDDASKEVTENIESQLAQKINAITQNVASTKANADAAAGSAIASHQSEFNALGSEQAAGKHAEDAANILTQITLTETEIQQQATGVSSAKNEIDLKAAEVLQAKQDIDKNAASAKISETNSAQYEQGAKQALSEVKQEISTHGGIPGKDGASAYEIWKENQPAGADTSLTAFLNAMKGTAGGGASLADIEPGEVGSIIFGMRYGDPGAGVLFAGQDIDGHSVVNPSLRWDGEDGQELKLVITPRERYEGTWTALQNMGMSGIGLFVRKR